MLEENKGLRGKKKKSQTEKATIFYFSLKLSVCISLSGSVTVSLCVSPRHSPEVFQKAQAWHCAFVSAVYVAQLGDPPPRAARMSWLWYLVGRDGMPGGQRSHRGSRCSQPDARLPARSQFSNMTNFLLPTAPLSCFWHLPLLSLMQQRLYCREGHSQFKGRKAVYSVFWGDDGGNNYTAAQPVALVLSDCLAYFQRKASCHYRNYHIIWLFMVPLKYRICFNKTFVLFPAFRIHCIINS